MRHRALLLACIACAATLCGCGRGSTPHTTLTLRGGPSPLRALGGVIAEFERQHPEITVNADFGCPPCVLPPNPDSNARPDVLVAMGKRDISRLQQAGVLTPGPVSTCGSARLALVAPQNARKPIHVLGDLLTDAVHKVGIGDPEQTDLGAYTVAAFKRAGMYGEIPRKLAPAKSGCDLLKSVALSINDAAIVYDFCVAVDTGSARRVQVLSTDLYDPIPMLIVANQQSEDAAQAQTFVDFVASEAARPLLEAKGVQPPLAK
jgi:molybdenum ABC transporter molybdate-binding protein